jgi:hypothetical protein
MQFIFPKSSTSFCSLALYQANMQSKPTEGEAYIYRGGGVGTFGEYGVKDNWLKPEKWTR